MFEKEMAFAKEAAGKAAEYLDSLDRTVVNSQQGRDIKVQADLESERLLIGVLAASGLPILTEESGSIGTQKGPRWIVDPLDGTFNYYRGLKELSCVSVALWEDDRPILGVVRRLGRSSVFEGNVANGTAALDGFPIRVSGVLDPSQAALLTGLPVYAEQNENTLRRFIRLFDSFKKVRLLGAAALMSSFIGAGYCDVYTEDGIKLWDIAAGAAITLAAGGSMRLTVRDDDTCRIALCASDALLSFMDSINAPE